MWNSWRIMISDDVCNRLLHEYVYYSALNTCWTTHLLPGRAKSVANGKNKRKHVRWRWLSTRKRRDQRNRERPSDWRKASKPMIDEPCTLVGWGGANDLETDQKGTFKGDTRVSVPVFNRWLTDDCDAV